MYMVTVYADIPDWFLNWNTCRSLVARIPSALNFTGPYDIEYTHTQNGSWTQ